MARLRILVPDGTTNYIKNPAARYATTGANAVGATVTRSLDYARFGIASFQVVTNGLAQHEGFYVRVSELTNVNDYITVSAYVRGTGSVRIRLIDNPNGQEWSSPDTILIPDRWQRIEATGRCTGSNDMRLYVESSKASAQAITFYADGLQMERHSYATTYCDGDQEGCAWNVMQHNSVSTREAYTRLGGRWVTIYGKDYNEKDLYMTVAGGLGMAPIRNNIQPFADAPGSYYQNTKTLDRVTTFNFNVKRKGMKPCPPASLRYLHELRQMLIDLIKPDLTYGGEEFTLEYTDGMYPIYVKMRYEGGLEGEWDLRNQWINSFPVRFLSVSPYMWEDNQDVSDLSIRESASINYALQRTSGVWSEMNGGFNQYVNEFAIGRQGEVIAVGEYITANNKVSAVDPQIFANYVAYWDGTQWRGYGTGANGPIYSVAVAPNGNVYVTGNFTSIGGVACNRIAMWNGTTWAALGTGLNASGFVVRVAPDGDVYVGGGFTTAGGKTVNYVARWDGGTWFPMGVEGGLNDVVYALAISSDGTQVFVGGAFTDEFSDPGSVTINRVTLYIPDFNEFFELGDGFDDVVRKLRISPSGRLYACGEFTESGTQPMLYISYWNGASWYNMGVGANNFVRDIDISPEGYVLACGDFTRIGSVDAEYVGLWNGTTWVSLDAQIYNACYAVKWGANGSIYLSPNGTLANFAAITNVVNTSTAETNPRVYIVGPGRLRWLENQTTKKRLYAAMDILDDEEVFINFGTGIVESSVRGDLSYEILPGSDLRAWSLIPGTNRIAMLITDDVAAYAQIGYVQRHWSVDASNARDSF